jgi:hypothetical protein
MSPVPIPHAPLPKKSPVGFQNRKIAGWSAPSSISMITPKLASCRSRKVRLVEKLRQIAEIKSPKAVAEELKMSEKSV